MLSFGNFQTQPQSFVSIHKNPSSHFVPNFSKIHQPQLFFSSNEVYHLRKNCSFLWRKRNGVCIFAQKSKEKSGYSVDDTENFDDDDDDDMDGFLMDDVHVDEDDEEEFVPLKNMKKWLEKKPKGFGVDKDYDTSVEDKLMEEIEQSKKAQLANINKLKNNPIVKAKSKEKQVKGSTISKDVQAEFRVRLVHLPKKKNIDRDLRAAFKGVPGIAGIVPLVTGNEKTRDPICKGLAYVDFRSANEAQRFVEMFSGQSIDFGKVQKKIKCEMIKPGSSTSTKTVNKIKYAPLQELPELHGNLDDGSNTDLSSDSEDEENISNDHVVAEIEEVSARTNYHVEISSLESTSGDEQDVSTESNFSENVKKIQAKEKKKKPKQKKEKAATLNVSGSARKLKIKEKALLTGVLTKYAQKTSS